MGGRTKKNLLCTGIIICGLMILTYVMDEQEQVLQKDHQIVRGEPGAGEREVRLQLEVPDMEQSVPYTVTVGERDFTKKEEEQAYEQAKEEIAQVFFAEGESASHVSKSVNLVDTLVDDSIDVNWEFGDSEVIEQDGTIREEYVSEEGTLVQVQANLSHGSWECIYTFPVMVYPACVDDMDTLMQRLDQRLEQQEHAGGDQLYLPTEIAGHALAWTKKKQHTAGIILMLGIAAGIVVVLSERETERQKKEQWRKRMAHAYPQMVAKMSLLIGAGMSVRQAWAKLAERMPAELQEQMQITLRQMEDGEGELRAYEQFGERSGMAIYRRFAMLLIQNLQKGNSGLRAAMEAEADRAFEDRKNQARRLGEEAGTKLMLPMMLMLGIVFAILMIPALLNMQIS